MTEQNDTREALDAQTYSLREDGEEFDQIEAESADAALEIAVAGCTADNFPELTETIWVEVSVRCLTSDENGDDRTQTVEVDPPEPPCVDPDGHDWQRPHELVGGLEENPGVFGHGGSVIIDSVCARCDRSKSVDYWAMNPTTGEQGLVATRFGQR